MRGPKVEFVSPGDSASSPLPLVLKFQSYGGAKIDPESVKIIFLRTPNVDLTSRVKPFVKADGINMQDAELPRANTWCVSISGTVMAVRARPSSR